jgi:peptide/nickel transport system substrate-binding protein
VAGEFDMTFGTDVTIPLLKDVTSQAPKAVCELAPTYVSSNLIINPKAPPFSDPKVRRAMALAIDRKAFIEILSNGRDDISGAMLPPPAGVWGMPPEELQKLPGYSADVEKSRAEGRKIMEGLGYETSRSCQVATRNIAVCGILR